MSEYTSAAPFSKITKNALFLVIYHLMNGIVQFLFFLFLIRIIPKSHMDVFELGRSCLEIGVGIIGSSVAMVIIRENARNPNWWLANSRQVKRLLLNSTLSVGLFIYALILLRSFSMLHAIIVGAFCITIYFQSRTDIFEAFFRSKDQVKYPILIGATCNVAITLITLLFVILFPYPVIWAALGVLVRWIIQGSILYGTIPNKEESSHSQNPIQYKNLFKDVLPISLGVIAFIIYARIDVLMLQWMGYEETIATYSCAFRPIGFISMFAAAFYQAFAPSISRMIHRNSLHALKITSLIGLLFSCIGLVLAFTLIHFSDSITGLIYPESYQLAAEGIRVLAWSFPIVFGGNAVGYYLVNYGKQGVTYYMAINIVGVLFNITGNLIVIHKYNFIGAAWTTVITDGLTTMLMIVCCLLINFRTFSHSKS